MPGSMMLLKNGNSKQRKAFHAIEKLGVMEDLEVYSPVVCGTIPIAIDLDASDLDIIFCVSDLGDFKQRVIDLYGKRSNFRVKQTRIRDRDVLKTNFDFEGFEFELFAQNQAVHRQFAYLHMKVEHEIIKENPAMKEKVIDLKRQGYKTEPAFCKVLDLRGDPYKALLNYGEERGYIKMPSVNEITQEEFDQVRKKVVEYNMEKLPDSIKTPNVDFGFAIRNDEGEMIGGITANMFWHHAHIEFLWVDERYRKEGYGTLLIEKLEEFAKKEKCRLIYLDSFSFQAPEFYQKNGYEVFGKLDDHPKGYDLYFLQKRLG